jgi:L-aminopeptidase/D-esterase-like protein
MRFLEERRIGFKTAAVRVPIVVGAVLYDLGIGDASVRPDGRSGYLACEAACPGMPEEGSVGAGTGATVAKLGGAKRAWKGGIASASERLQDGTVVAALVAVNAVGDIFDPVTFRRVASPRPDEEGRAPTALDVLRARARRRDTREHTTLAIVATSASLTRTELQRVAEMANTGLARAIEPVLTSGDGDVVFALSTEARPRGRSRPDLLAIGGLGAHAVARAVVRAVESAEGLAGVPAVSDLAKNSSQDPH